MVKYSARVDSSGLAEQKKRGNPKKNPIDVKKGGDLAVGGVSGVVASGLTTGGDLVVGGKAEVDKILKDSAPQDITVRGGSVPSVKKVTKKIESVVSDAVKVVKSIAKVPTAESLKNIIDRLTHHGMGQVLQNMDLSQFHILQGVAGAHLSPMPNHFMSAVAKQVLGGSFTHPKDISKMATRDILRAVTPQQLSTALHLEMLDMRKGMNVGGGLLSSLKHHFKRGMDGLQSRFGAATNFGKSLSSALSKGIKVGQAFSPVVNALFPGAGALLKTGITAAEALKAGLETGIRVGESIEKKLESISPIQTGRPDNVTADVIPKEVTTPKQTPSFAGLTPSEIESLGFTPEGEDL